MIPLYLKKVIRWFYKGIINTRVIMGARNVFPLTKQLQNLEREVTFLESELKHLPIQKHEKAAVIPWFTLLTGQSDLRDYFRSSNSN